MSNETSETETYAREEPPEIQSVSGGIAIGQPLSWLEKFKHKKGVCGLRCRFLHELDSMTKMNPHGRSAMLRWLLRFAYAPMAICAITFPIGFVTAALTNDLTWLVISLGGLALTIPMGQLGMWAEGMLTPRKSNESRETKITDRAI